MWMFKAETGTGQCDEHQHQLLTSLTTYIELYNCHEDFFKTTAENFARVSVQTRKQSKASQKDCNTRALLGGLGGASLGGTFGVLGGCVGGGLGGVCAAALYSEDLNPLGATAGFFGAILGGAVGATFAGVLGGGLGAAAESAGRSVDNGFYELVWGIVGGVTGAGIGHIFGGKVGLVGGTFGGSIGGFIGVGVSVGLIKTALGQIKDVREAQNPEKQKDEVKKELVFQIFKRNTSPLVAELLIINDISNKLGRSEARAVAAQSSKCLRAVSGAEKALVHVQFTPQSAAYWEKAAEQSKRVSEELLKMKSEGEKLLASWSQ